MMSWTADLSGSSHLCELCGSTAIQWFTPVHSIATVGIFLCLVCAKINVRLPFSCGSSDLAP